VICPICQSSKFHQKSGRNNAKCDSCLAIERTRLLYMVLEKFELLKPNIRILHVEPEPALMKIFSRISPSSYFPFSVNPDRYNTDVLGLKSPCDMDKFPYQSFDLIIHNHFLEQIPLPVKYSLKVFSEILKPGGHHLFTTMIEKGSTKEGLEKLSNDERIKRFGQVNRFHKFGIDDFIPLLQDFWRDENVYIKNEEIFSLHEYLDAALPEKSFSMITPSTIFFQKGEQPIL
jgi:SAM-dependent methyltransferase